MLVTVASNKGGVGKTSLAIELAYSLQGILVDLDWDYGSATRACGVDPVGKRRSSLLDALVGEGRIPSTLRLSGRPELVPSHPLIVEIDASEADVAAKLRSWAEAWRRDVVIDTHPGAASLTYAAMAAADLVVVPVVLAGRELDALEGLLAEAAEFRLLLVPNRVARWPDLAAINRLEELATRYQVPVAPGISDHHWWPRRKRRTAVGSATPPGGALARAQAELHQLAESVRKEAAR
jgi:chromosome partitioning protein